MSEQPMLYIIPHALDDRAACLRVFDSNVPRFFATHERDVFSAFLDAIPGPFWVVRSQPDGVVIGCGGVSLADEGRTAWLRWGMVDAGHHKQGSGRQLLATRLEWIAAQPRVEAVRVATTAEPSGFFQRMGFELIEVVNHRYGPGMNRYDLMLSMVSAKS